MSAVLSKLPFTYEALIKVAGKELIRVPASFDEYWHFIGQAEFRADFYQNEIIAMSYENEHHSEIMMDFTYLLQQAFPKVTRKFVIHNSNRPIYVGNFSSDHSVFNPGGSVVVQPAIHFEYSPGMNAETTPVLLFEILSKSTRSYDFGVKLPLYKQITTLNTIVYIETKKRSILVMERKNKNSWMETEYTKEDDSFLINNFLFSLKDIYFQLKFD